MSKPLRICLIDMNNGHENQAIRCFRVLIETFFNRVRVQNPQLQTELEAVQPRNLQELPTWGADLYLSSGGPGSPYEHDGEPWLGEMYGFYDRLVNENRANPRTAPALFGVCYTFELLVRHFDVATMVERDGRKFGVMPIYMTPEGQEHLLTAPFNDRLFAFEHRNWEAVGPKTDVMRGLGSTLLAQESRDGYSKGRAALAFDFAPGIVGTQFHPEADRAGVVAWVSKRDQAAAFVEAYGAVTYERMIKTLDTPSRLAKTYSLMIPGWMVRNFNRLAQAHAWRTLPEPVLDTEAFDADAPPAQSVKFHSLLPIKAAAPVEAQMDWDSDPLDLLIPDSQLRSRTLSPTLGSKHYRSTQLWV